jgi:hypothetical protein
MAFTPGVTVIKGKLTLEELVEALALALDVEVLVGFPDDGSYRKEETGETDDYGKAILGKGAADVTNAMLGYIHDNGSPEANIPARSFMLPGIEAVRPRLESRLASIINGVVKRGEGTIFVEMHLIEVGVVAQKSIQNTINEGIPPPLAESTLRARAKRGRKGAGIELLSRSMGLPPSMDFAKPLVDTAQMRNAVNFVLRSRKLRKP